MHKVALYLYYVSIPCHFVIFSNIDEFFDIRFSWWCSLYNTENTYSQRRRPQMANKCRFQYSEYRNTSQSLEIHSTISYVAHNCQLNTKNQFLWTSAAHRKQWNNLLRSYGCLRKWKTHRSLPKSIKSKNRHHPNPQEEKTAKHFEMIM